MKVHELREGDKFKSLNPEVKKEGIIIAHRIYQGRVKTLAIIWEDDYAEIDKFHFWWDRDCELVLSGNDVTNYQKIFKRHSIHLE